MAYKTILTILTDSDHAAQSLDPVLAFAAAHGAHVDILALAVDRSQASFPVAGMGMAIQDITLAAATEQRDEIATAARAAADKGTVPVSVEGAVAPAVSVSAVVAARARMADLVMIQKPYGPGMRPEAPVIVESAMFQGRAPALVLPAPEPLPATLDRVLIAWNESPEALAAVRAALPLLKAAKAVTIVVIDPPRHGVGMADPGAELAKMLARHGVPVSVAVVAQTMVRTSDTLARECADRKVDLMVLGAYSHSRFREAILGGTTRNLLEHTEVPVFMAH